MIMICTYKKCNC